MKPAEEYLTEKFLNAKDQDWFKPVVVAINAARIDAISECAQQVYRGRFTGNAYVNKQSILNLINEVR
jgi:hypothetical protein